MTLGRYGRMQEEGLEANRSWPKLPVPESTKTISRECCRGGATIDRCAASTVSDTSVYAPQHSSVLGINGALASPIDESPNSLVVCGFSAST